MAPPAKFQAGFRPGRTHQLQVEYAGHLNHDRLTPKTYNRHPSLFPPTMVATMSLCARRACLCRRCEFIPPARRAPWLIDSSSGSEEMNRTGSRLTVFRLLLVPNALMTG